jgi:uncharacterized protein (DUF3084 family)
LHGITAAAQANQEIKAELERLTAAAQAEEAKDASLAADVQQMRLEVAAKQVRKHAVRLKRFVMSVPLTAGSTT